MSIKECCSFKSHATNTYKHIHTRMSQRHTHTQAFYTFCTWLCVVLLLEVVLGFLTSRCSAGGDSGGVSDSASSSLSISSSPLIIPTASNKHYRIIHTICKDMVLQSCMCMKTIFSTHNYIHIINVTYILPMELLQMNTPLHLAMLPINCTFTE